MSAYLSNASFARCRGDQTEPSDVCLANLILMLIVVSPLTLPANVDADWYGWLRQTYLRLVVDLRHERELLRHISVASNLPWEYYRKRPFCHNEYDWLAVHFALSLGEGEDAGNPLRVCIY